MQTRNPINNSKLKEVDVVILCGGEGTRLRTVVNDRPKPMAEVNGAPFLDIPLDCLASQGFTKSILCVGYMGQQIEQYYRAKKTNLKMMFSRESSPLGTGGAVKNAKTLIESDFFLVLNGDSYCDLDFLEFINFHLRKKALVTIAVSELAEAKDYGTIVVDEQKQLVSFCEKTPTPDKAYVNAGIYCMSKAAFLLMPDRDEFSLEYDYFPAIINNQCFAYVTGQPFIDIGTPERYSALKRTKEGT